MQKKFMFAALVVGTGLILTIYSFASRPLTQPEQTTVPAEQTSAAPAGHCDPSDCTPEKAAACPYSNSTTAQGTNDCPVTKDCPPSACKPGSNKATL